ncbi:MAG: type VI-C CRISPR-associated RNA-guided ribonuclease Cas13c [Cetobacterium sp.]|uniref:type VI-C CRISPR-associated RNA-guided ribonuclease Cas13c n=1 Tax=Cetobacterium sp. TaxID=2071632 RepID=UPI003F2BFF02
MEKDKTYKPKQNRSSIIRIILSNYDMIGIKELKILYQKQGGVDTFNLESSIDLDSRKVIIKSFKVKAKEIKRYSFSYDTEDNFSEDKNSVTVTKVDNILNKEIRKYKITLSLKEKTTDVILAEVEDKLEEPEKKVSGIRMNFRNRTSKTERKLLSQEVCKNYSEIARVSTEDIDSLKIYKIKRFLSYRSNLLMYFALINNFLCAPLKNEGITEIWKISKNDAPLSDERLEKITGHVFNTLSKEIENRVNQLQKKISKNNREIEEFKISYNHKNKNKQKSNQLESINKDLDKKISELSGYSSKENLKQDLKKVIEIFSNFRHALMHYDYMYFENLFENKACDNLKNLLDLNFFKYTKLIEGFKIENKTNYLDGEEKLSVLGKPKNIKNLYSYYNTLCNNKSGFNKFINSFFTSDGMEDADFKKLITEDFENEMNIMKGVSKKNLLTTKNLNRMESHFKLMKGTPYFWDIHTSEIYKELYNKRKELVAQYNKEINGIRSNTSIIKINSELLELKKQMEEITKNNALFRLKYKLQIAYAFLMDEFKGDLKSFKNNFDPTNLDDVQKYLNKKKKYLSFRISELEEREKDVFNLGKLEKKLKRLQGEVDKKDSLYLDVNSKNNLFKFYILNYLLLPIEFKGDFLGFVKTHYYNIKNVDFLDESDENLTNEKLNEKLKELSDDSFFYKIRLFEKNIKNYEVIKYSISTHEDMKRYFELLELNVTHLEYKSTDEVGIFNKNMLLPIFKYYQNVFKLYNDIEIHGFLSIAHNKNINLEKALAFVKGKGKKSFLNFSNLLKKINENDYEEQAEIRNSIAHLNLRELIENLFTNELKLNETVRAAIEFSLNNELNKVDLGMDFINDYYMKKQRFIFNQRRLVPTHTNNTKREAKKKQNDALMKKYRLNLDSENLNKIYYRANELRRIADGVESVDQNKELFSSIKIDNIPFLKLDEKIKNKILIKDSSGLMGVYKEHVVKKLKKKIIEKFIYDEEKIITINVYKASIKQTDSFIIKLKRVKDSDTYSFDEKSVRENEYYSCTENSGVVTVVHKYSVKNIEFKFDLRSGYVFGKTIVFGTK